MTLYEVTFRLKHDCPYNGLSEQYPEAVFSHWCNNESDVLEIVSEPEAVRAIQRNVLEVTHKLGVKVQRKVVSKANQQLIVAHCGCNHYWSTCPTIERNNCLELQPTIYRDGWEWYRVISFSESDMKRLFKELDEFCKVEVVSRSSRPEGTVKDTMLISALSLLGSLTRKQLEALNGALESGYYRVPKKVTTEGLATRFGVPRTTYEEHLRKAESKVLLAVAP